MNGAEKAQLAFYPPVSLPGVLENDLHRLNPWWSGGRGVPLPPHRRHLVGQIQKRLSRRIAPIVLIRGSRQIGKTTSQLQVLEQLLREGVPPARLMRVQFDELPSLRGVTEPILRIVDWFERFVLGKTLNQAAHDGEPTYLFFDEVQNLKDWAPQLKSLVDSSATQAVVTGSSALRIEAGRDSLAGRITTIEAGVLSLTEIAMFRGIELGPPFLSDNGIEPLGRLDFWKELQLHGRRLAADRDTAFRHFSDRGGYPLVHKAAGDDWPLLADQLNETVIRRVIQHDLRLGERGRKRDSALLEEVFRLACRYAGQAVPIQALAKETREALSSNAGVGRVRHYLRFLADSLLLRLIEPLEIRLKRRRASPKICLADHGLRASWLQERVPLAPEDLSAGDPALSTLAGRLAESVVGAALSTISSLDLAHLPGSADQPEIDFVLTVGARRIPLEVKYQKTIDPVRDTSALRRFLDKRANNAPFGILLTQRDERLDLDTRIVSVPLSTLLLLR